MVGLLVLVLVAIDRAREPSSWYWLTGAPPPAPPPAAPPATTPRAGPPDHRAADHPITDHRVDDNRVAHHCRAERVAERLDRRRRVLPAAGCGQRLAQRRPSRSGVRLVTARPGIDPLADSSRHAHLARPRRCILPRACVLARHTLRHQFPQRSASPSRAIYKNGITESSLSSVMVP